MPRPLGPHRPGVPAFDTLTSAAERLVTQLDGAIDARALEVMIDDALAPEVMVGERVDTIMLSSHVFGLGADESAAAPTTTGRPGLIAFTERRMIAAHAEGIVRLRRWVEAFTLDGGTDFTAVTPTVSGQPVALFEIANAQGRHRLFLPDPTEVPAHVVAAWDRHIAARLVGALMPRWDDRELVGWDRGNPTVPTRRPPGVAADVGDDEVLVDPSGPLPATDLSGDVRWWEN